MSQEAYEALCREMLGGREASAGLYQRWQDLQAREAQWRAAREQAQADGLPVPDMFDDATYAALESERKALMETQQQTLARPRLDAAAMAALRTQLTLEEKAQLRQDLLASIQSSPPEIREKTIDTLNEVAQRIREKQGSTPEVDVVLAKVERLKDQMNGSA